MATKRRTRPPTAGLTSGYRLRPATMDDAEGYAALANCFSEHVHGERPFCRQRIEQDWGYPNISPQSNIRIVENEGGEPVGGAELWDDGVPPVALWALGFVHPEHTNHGIGSALLTWLEERGREAIPRCPYDARVVLQLRVLSGHSPSEQLVAEHGFELHRHVWRMEIEFGAPPNPMALPEGIELRPYRHDEDLPAVLRADYEAFEDHWGYVEQPEETLLEQWQHWIATKDDFDPALWHIAYDGDEIAGVCLSSFKSPYNEQHGYVNTLAVRRPWRRRGLAIALLQRAFVKFVEVGRSGAALHVDAANTTGATKLYEKAGMHVAQQYDWYEKQLRSGRSLMNAG